MRVTQLLGSGLLAVAVQAQTTQTEWQQCGGIGWTGGTICASGLVCTQLNPYYFQCLPGTASTTTTSTTSSSKTTSTTTTSPITTTTSTKTTTTSTSTKTTTTVSSTPPPSGKFKWLGVDESGAEFGSSSYPGVWGKDFIFPSTSSLDTLIAQGFNSFRLPFAMERMAPNGLAAALSPAYLANYTAIVNHITAKGAYAIVDPHNFGRYNGNIITSTSDFQTFWTNLASNYASNTFAIFDTNNEYHDMDQTLVFNLNQAAINGIRSTGATSQYIFVEGNSYSGAWTWVATNTNLGALTDPSNKIVFEMHQYLDSDGSGTSNLCVNTTIGVNRITSATQWLIDNNKLGVIGEYAGGANSDCLTAVTGMLNYMQQNSDVWLGALWWGGGPWWPSTYIYVFEPPSSLGYNYYDSTLIKYAP